MKLVVATRNHGKLRELEALLEGIESIEVLGLDAFPDAPEVEETGETFEANARLKAHALAVYTGLPCVADDSGLEVDALGGAPGVHSARYAGTHGGDRANNEKLLAALRDVEGEARGARFRCALVYLAGPSAEAAVFHGAMEGCILEAPRGEGGFGYDPVFAPLGESRSAAELPAEEKNRMSHRGKAVAAFVRWLEVEGER